MVDNDIDEIFLSQTPKLVLLFPPEHSDILEGECDANATDLSDLSSNYCSNTL